MRETLDRAFPWCAEWEEPLKGLFALYVETKQAQAVLDYDDLLLYWSQMMRIGEIACLVSDRFDHVLVDEYQDTNALQASILLGLKPDGAGITVVGDDAQAIYSFRSATVRNILDFPSRFDPPAEVVRLEQNYRSTQPILKACNRIIARAGESFAKDLFTTRPGGRRPLLAMVADETAQVEFVIQRILANREAGWNCVTRRSSFAPRTTSASSRSRWSGETSPSSSSAASSFSRPPTSRTSWPSCAGRKTRATTSPVFASSS